MKRIVTVLILLAALAAPNTAQHRILASQPSAGAPTGNCKNVMFFDPTTGRVYTCTTNNWTLYTSLPDPKIAAYAALGSVIKGESVGGTLAHVTVGTALASGTLIVQAVYLPVGATLTGVKFYQSVQGAYTADAYNGVGLYTYSGGTLTLVASSTNDGNIWKAAVGLSLKTFTSTYAAAPGLYFVGALYHSSAQTTAPSLGAYPAAIGTPLVAGDFTNSAKLSSTLASQTALPTPQASSGLTASASQIYFAVY